MNGCSAFGTLHKRHASSQRRLSRDDAQARHRCSAAGINQQRARSAAAQVTHSMSAGVVYSSNRQQTRLAASLHAGMLGEQSSRVAKHSLDARRRLVVLQQAADGALGGGQRAVEHVHKLLLRLALRRLRHPQPHVQPPRLQRSIQHQGQSQQQQRSAGYVRKAPARIRKPPTRPPGSTIPERARLHPPPKPHLLVVAVEAEHESLKLWPASKNASGCLGIFGVLVCCVCGIFLTDDKAGAPGSRCS